MSYTQVSRNAYLYMEFLCDSENDLSSLPTSKISKGGTKCAIGSKAIMMDTKDVFILGNDDTWVYLNNITSGGGGIGSLPDEAEIATPSEVKSALGI